VRIVTFGPRRRVGVWVDEFVVDVNAAAELLLREDRDVDAAAHAARWAPAALADFIEAGEAAIAFADRAADRARDGGIVEAVHRVPEAGLRAPWPGRRIACAGGNFADHLLGMLAGSPEHGDATLDSVTRTAREQGQWGFWKVPSEVAGPGDAIESPRRCRYFDYEGEVAIVIGRRGRDIAASDLREFVWGISLVNDWSIRDRSAGPRRPMSYNLGKNFDGCVSMGPCIVVGGGDGSRVSVETRVNGEVRQSFDTSAMLFDFGEIIEFLSADLTFVPGDVICGGTGAGTAADSSPRDQSGDWTPNRFLSPGDVVEVVGEGIGTLVNEIVPAGGLPLAGLP